ncbi:MAG TPA: hypothetical protein VF194_02275 [Ferrovibrio sp.]|jgi:hypothetical protein|uniref:hypothetical protein n=1 Tax=Ferrovibrio sp. TaxID=1917215 RepID=UPI002ED4ED10
MLKFLLLILVIAAVWYGYRYVNRKEQTGARVAPAPAQPRVKAEDLVACRICGAYVAEATAKSCGRQDCPYPQA